MLTWGRAWGNREVVLDGVTVGYFETGFFRERATVVLGAETWEFRRVAGGGIEGSGPLGAPVQHRLVASKTSIWSYSWDVVTPVARYQVKGGVFASGFQVLRGGVPLGEARRAGSFTSRFGLALPPDVPLLDQVFLLWIVEASERRRSHQSAGATS